MSSRARACFEVSVELTSDVALEAALDLAVGSAFGVASFGVGAGGGVVAEAAEGDDMQRAVELSVAGTVEPVADGLPGGGGGWGSAGEHGEGGFVMAGVGVGPGG